MRIAVDLHIHSCLSPCADDDMTPHDIVGMAVIKGLQAIAVTDHNTCGNVAAVMEAAREAALCVVPGLEVTTREDVHALCYFASLASAESFAHWLDRFRVLVPNKPAYFGEQLYRDAKDQITGCEPYLLLTAVEKGLEEIEAQTWACGGVMVPAHIDREEHGLLSTLGMIPSRLRAKSMEYARYIPDLCNRDDYLWIRSSDAHLLDAILEREQFLDVSYCSAQEIVNILKHTSCAQAL